MGKDYPYEYIFALLINLFEIYSSPLFHMDGILLEDINNLIFPWNELEATYKTLYSMIKYLWKYFKQILPTNNNNTTHNYKLSKLSNPDSKNGHQNIEDDVSFLQYVIDDNLEFFII